MNTRVCHYNRRQTVLSDRGILPKQQQPHLAGFEEQLDARHARLLVLQRTLIARSPVHLGNSVHLKTTRSGSSDLMDDGGESA